jgi:hypothetical protein
VRVLLTGSTGFIGSALLRALAARGDEVVEVVRTQPGPGQVRLDVDAGSLDCSRLPEGGLDGVEAAVHLAGAAILGRWTARSKEVIRSSRIAAGFLLASRLAALDHPPAAYVTGSAIGFYGDTGESEVEEGGACGEGFLADVCRSWEASAAPASEAGIRVVALRTGIVLGSGGGALAPQLRLFRLGLGGRLGSGRQWTSWISLDDEVRAILRVLDDAAISGPVNLTAPNPVRNTEMTSALATAVGRPAVIPVPAAVLWLALGRGPADEMLLASQRVRPARLIEAGFEFAHPRLDAALSAALASSIKPTTQGA